MLTSLKCKLQEATLYHCSNLQQTLIHRAKCYPQQIFLWPEHSVWSTWCRNTHLPSHNLRNFIILAHCLSFNCDKPKWNLHGAVLIPSIELDLMIGIFANLIHNDNRKLQSIPRGNFCLKQSPLPIIFFIDQLHSFYLSCPFGLETENWKKVELRSPLRTSPGQYSMKEIKE